MFSFYFAPTASDASLASMRAHPPPVSAHGVKIPHWLQAQAGLGTGHGLIMGGWMSSGASWHLWAAGQGGLA